MKTLTKRVLPMCLGTFALLVCSTTGGSGREPSVPSRFSFAYVQPACGPTDGPALEFYFTAKQARGGNYEVPYVLISINEDLPTSAPHDYSIKPRRSQMLAFRCASLGGCMAATAGTLHLIKFNTGKGTSGTYELYFKGGGVEMGEFDAKWYSVKNLICG